MYGVVLHAHPVRGESHNQRNTTGEVATPPVITSTYKLFDSDRHQLFLSNIFLIDDLNHQSTNE